MAIPKRMVVTVLFACLASGSTAIAQDPKPSNSNNSNALTRTAGGWVAFLDPETGQLVERPVDESSVLRITREELYEYSRDDYGLEMQISPDGGEMVNLEGRFREGTVATVRDDDHLDIQRIGGRMFSSKAGRAVRDQLNHEIREATREAKQ